MQLFSVTCLARRPAERRSYSCLAALAFGLFVGCGGPTEVAVGDNDVGPDTQGSDAQVADTSDIGLLDMIADEISGQTDAAVDGGALLDSSDAADASSDAAPQDGILDVGPDTPDDGLDATSDVAPDVGPDVPDGATGCKSDKDCAASGKVCDPLNKVCVGCLTDVNCAANQHCIAYTCESPTTCINSLSCVGVKSADGSTQPICDPSVGTCAACLTTADCPVNSDCAAKKCVPFTPCQNSTECSTDQVCDPVSSRCIQCVTSNDCGTNSLCELGTCKPFVACVSDKQCTPFGLLCDTAKGKCAQCIQNKDCPDVYNCQKVGVSGTGQCVLDACIAGQGACVGGQKVVCDAGGKGLGSPEACPEKTGCVASGGQLACKPWLCKPGLNCDGDKLVHCSDDGMTVLDTADCAASAQKCYAGTCKPALCGPATLFCEGATLKTCSPDGFSVVASKLCGAGTYCGLGLLGDAGCQPVVCEPGTAQCDGTKPAVCNSDGSALIVGATDCQSLSKWCVDGACVASCQTGAAPLAWYKDGDADGYGVLSSPVVACQSNGLYTSLTPTDCDDANATVHPGQSETCGDGIDNDCNGKTDEANAADCLAWYSDKDGDGYGSGTAQCLCAAPGEGYSKNGGDCDDGEASVHPKAPEVCDGVDNDCNGFADALDPGLPLTDPQYCANQLGVCAGSAKTISLCSGGVWQACSTTDYKKYDSAYGSTEICDDKDNNCNGVIDEGCDDDKDGYCDSSFATLGFPLSCPKGGGDCDDGNSKTKPGAKELCDDLDSNCNGVADEGCDKDGDGWCDASLTTFGGPKICPAGGGDCNDANQDIRPDAAEKCNGIDDDCNAATDENWPDLGLVCADGKGQCAVKGVKVCKADNSTSTCSIQPGPPQTEICDNLDNDCNGATDEGCDSDFDGYCDANMGAIGHPYACLAGPGDCDDSNMDVHPGAKELCDNVDNDCDAKTDADDGDILNDDPQLCEQQNGACAGSKKYATMCKGGVWAKCDSTQYQGWNIYYSAVENCDNVDNDCNGTTDEVCDVDDDGYCAANKKILGAPTTCSTKDPFTGQDITHTGDCDDTNAANFPGNAEFCDGKDNNCNSQQDEGCDKDFDGYCDAKLITIGKPQVCPSGGNDCNDDSKLGGTTINPGTPETCFDSIDNNCNGSTDEGCNWYFSNVDLKGPDYTAEGLYQCAGYLDLPNSNDIPDSGWGGYCANTQWKRVRIACGQKPAAGAAGAQWPVMRSIDLAINPFLPGALTVGYKFGAIVSTNGFSAGASASILQSNLLALYTALGDTNNYALDYTYSWIGAKYGFDENHWSLIVNNPSGPFEAANCFGLGLWDNVATPNNTNARGLLVYVGR